MNKIKQIFKQYNNSLVGYLPIKLLDGLAGVIALKIYVNLFVTDDYGEFGIYLATVGIVYLVLIGWIGLGANRFAKLYNSKGEKEKEQFYSTVFLAFFSIYIGLFAVAMVVFNFFPGIIYGRGVEFGIALLVMLLGYCFMNMFINMLLYVEERKLNVWLVLVSSIMKPALTVVLYFVTDGSIISIILGHGLTDVLVGVIAIKRLKVFKYLKIKSYDSAFFKQLMKFGYPLIGLSLAMFLLSVSDQYIIVWAHGKAANGIYKANYSISQSTMIIIVVGIARAVYPRCIKEWHDGDFVEAAKTVALGFRYYLMLALPAATGLFLLSEDFAKILLQADYVEGHVIMGIVGFAMMFYGMTEFANKGYELEGNTVPIFFNGLVAALINLVLNIILVPTYGYKIAAFTTLIGFIVYFLLAYIRRTKQLKWSIDVGVTIKIVLSSMIMAGVIMGIKAFTPNTMIMTLVTVIVAMIVYGISIFMFGLLKEEISRFRNVVERH